MQDDSSLVELLEAGCHRPRRRLAATGRAEQREELALGDREADVIDCSDPSEALADALEGDRDGPFVRHPRRVCHLTEGYRLVRVSSSLADEGEDAAPTRNTV